MRRLIATTLAFFALVGAAGASPDGWGPWESTYQGAITAAAGLVCPFTVQAAPVRESFRVRYHRDAAGGIDAYETVGPLIARITNVENGKSVTRNLSGFGLVTLGPDGSYDALVDGGFLVFFLGGDRPAHELLFTEGHTVLHGNPDGTKTLISTTGRTENLCETLA